GREVVERLLGLQVQLLGLLWRGLVRHGLPLLGIGLLRYHLWLAASPGRLRSSPGRLRASLIAGGAGEVGVALRVGGQDVLEVGVLAVAEDRRPGAELGALEEGAVAAGFHEAVG